MAPKKPLSDKPPSPQEPEEQEESSEEEEESSEEEEGPDEEEEGSEEEEEKNNPKTPLIPQNVELNKKPIVQKQITPVPQSPSDSGEEAAPHSPSVSDFLMKPIIPTKRTSKDSKPTPKRSSEAKNDDEKDARTKKKAKVVDHELKKGKTAAFSSVSAASGGGAGRVWGDEDIIGLLQGMIDYKDEQGADPSDNMVAFCEFVKGKLQVEFSRTQIYEKIRRLRIKFFNYVEKIEKGGEDPVFSKPHESEAFDLSKKIWGGGSGDGNGVDKNVHVKSNNNNNGKVKKSGKVVSSVDPVKEDKNKKNVVKELYTVKEDKNKKDVVEELYTVKEDKNNKNVVKELARDGDEGDFESKYPFLSLSLDFNMGRSIMFASEWSFLKENISLIGNAKAKELDGKWKKLLEAEAEVLLEKLDLMKELTKLVLEGMKEK